MKIYTVVDENDNPVLSQFYTTRQYAQSALDSFPKEVPIFANYAIKEVELVEASPSEA